MATPSTLFTLGTSSRIKGCTERAALRYQIALLRDRLPPHEATSLEIVHLEQVLGWMPVQHPRSQPLDGRGSLVSSLSPPTGRREVAGHYGARLGRMRVIHP
jgi:hypothetical protein